jgi:hypothetical protein
MILDWTKSCLFTDQSDMISFSRILEMIITSHHHLFTPEQIRQAYQWRDSLSRKRVRSLTKFEVGLPQKKQKIERGVVLTRRKSSRETQNTFKFTSYNFKQSSSPKTEQKTKQKKSVAILKTHTKGKSDTKPQPQTPTLMSTSATATTATTATTAIATVTTAIATATTAIATTSQNSHDINTSLNTETPLTPSNTMQNRMTLQAEPTTNPTIVFPPPTFTPFSIEDSVRLMQTLSLMPLNPDWRMIVRDRSGDWDGKRVIDVALQIIVGICQIVDGTVQELFLFLWKVWRMESLKFGENQSDTHFQSHLQQSHQQTQLQNQFQQLQKKQQQQQHHHLQYQHQQHQQQHKQYTKQTANPQASPHYGNGISDTPPHDKRHEKNLQSQSYTQTTTKGTPQMQMQMQAKAPSFSQSQPNNHPKQKSLHSLFTIIFDHKYHTKYTPDTIIDVAMWKTRLLDAYPLASYFYPRLTSVAFYCISEWSQNFLMMVKLEMYSFLLMFFLVFLVFLCFFLCFCFFVFLCFCVFVFLRFCVFAFLCFCVFAFYSQLKKTHIKIAIHNNHTCAFRASHSCMGNVGRC